VFSAQTFLTNFDKLSTNARRLVFGEQMADDLTTLAQLATAAKDGGTFRNLSRTGNAINLQRLFVGFAGHGSTAGLSGGVSLTVNGTQAALSAALGRFLSSPRGARAMAHIQRNGLTRAQAYRRVTEVGVRTPALQNDVQLILAALEGDGVTTGATEQVVAPTTAPESAAPQTSEAEGSLEVTPEEMERQLAEGTVPLVAPEQINELGDTSERDSADPSNTPPSDDPWANFLAEQ
jgi:hypothetical protein